MEIYSITNTVCEISCRVIDAFENNSRTKSLNYEFKI